MDATAATGIKSPALILLMTKAPSIWAFVEI
ncbi:unannotated protein [freshwater metagenome]|uniref:Unannotated protein n=1 Tax=freshwater metagenome TaxID=449393 RepID=A0A6J6UU55_9ZZZZ